VVNFHITLHEEGQSAYSSVSNHTLAIIEITVEFISIITGVTGASYRNWQCQLYMHVYLVQVFFRWTPWSWEPLVNHKPCP